MSKLSPDAYEYAFLKAIVLFSPGMLVKDLILFRSTSYLQSQCAMIHLCLYVVFASDHPGIDNTTQIERFQEKAYMELQDYVTRTYPEDSYRLA